MASFLTQPALLRTHFTILIAILMLRAFLAAEVASACAGFDLPAQELPFRLRLAREHLCRGGTDIPAIQAAPDTDRQRPKVIARQAGIGAHGGNLGGFEAAGDGRRKTADIHLQFVRVGLQHILGVTLWHGAFLHQREPHRPEAASVAMAV